MIKVIAAFKWAPAGVLCMVLVLLSACGGGGSEDPGGSATTMTYQVNATAGTGGTISPAATTVNSGGSVMLTVTVNSGFIIGSVMGCGGALSGTTFTTGSITSSCTVTASFIAQYAVTATAGVGGTILPTSVNVNAGSTTMLTVTANSGYAIGSVTGCGGTLGGNTYTTGAVNAACTVTASFIARYAVTATAGTGGTIAPTSVAANAGVTTTFTVIPKSGYVVSTVTGCGGTLVGTTYTTGPINAACTVTASFAAAFTWVGGASTPDSVGVYGTQGVEAVANVPGARDAVITWTDASGNVWMFGGFAGYASALDPTVGNFLNDVWKYSPSSGNWTWEGGSTTNCPQGAYGTQGVAAGANIPGGRSAGISWKDVAGNLWLYGGGGCDSTGAFVLYSDLWEYSPVSGQWTWVGGSQGSYVNANYGTQGVPAPANMPGSRAAAATWTDTSDNQWMFGGYGFTGSGGSIVGAYLDDLWEYVPSSGRWIWIGGPNTVNSHGVYGTQGVAQAANVPSARNGSVASWTDANGNFWLFGGYGYDSTGQIGELNDLWEYSPSTGKWTWEGGSNTANAPGVYGVQGTAAAGNIPGARGASVSWIDASGNMWLFGGETYDAIGHIYHRLNDLWKFSPSSGEWTWVAGSSTFDATGIYGTKGLAAIANVPGARAAASTTQDATGNVWLFGGYQFSSSIRHEMNDLWMYPAQ